MALWKKMTWPSSSRKEIRSPPIQKIPKKFEIFPVPSYKTRKKNSPPQKNYFRVGWVYIVKNKDNYTHYQKVVGPKYRYCRNYNQYHFFCLRFVFTIFYTGSHLHLKCQFPPKISIWPKSLLCKHSGKWFSPPPSHQPGGGGVQTMFTFAKLSVCSCK